MMINDAWRMTNDNDDSLEYNMHNEQPTEPFNNTANVFLKQNQQQKKKRLLFTTTRCMNIFNYSLCLQLATERSINNNNHNIWYEWM